jgi:hypothetical protein
MPLGVVDVNSMHMMKLAWWIHGMVYGKFVKIKILFEHLL